MNPRVVVTLITIVGLAVLLQACTGMPVTDEYRVEIAIPIPLYVATDQAVRTISECA